MSNNNRKWIAVTGGIGAGKNLITDYLSERGYMVIDMDGVSGLILRSNWETLPKIIDAFGADILNEDGELDRKKLAKKAFFDEKNVAALNEIMFPELRKWLEDMQAFSAEVEPRELTLSFVGIPLVFESKMDDLFDEIWAVSADSAIRIKRVMQREDCDEKLVRARMRWQISDEERNSRADMVIFNNSDKASVWAQVEDLLGLWYN